MSGQEHNQLASFLTGNPELPRFLGGVMRVAEGFSYHAGHRGADPGLIVNRVAAGCEAGVLAPLKRRVVALALALVKPGEDRSEEPVADAWLAPLDEAVLYERMKWRHLSQTRAGLSPGACDIREFRAKNASHLYDPESENDMAMPTLRLFCNADLQSDTDGFLLKQFAPCVPELIRKPHQACGFKTLFRPNEIYKKLGLHRPKGLKPDLWDQVRWLNGSGRAMARRLITNSWRAPTKTYDFDWVQVNQSAGRLAKRFLGKRDRSRMNHSVKEDRPFQRMILAVRAEMVRLTLSPEIHVAPVDLVECHREKTAERRATEACERFYHELIAARGERLCKMQGHFGSAGLATGPAMIPEDMLERNVAADFFIAVGLRWQGRAIRDMNFLRKFVQALPMVRGVLCRGGLSSNDWRRV